MAWLARRAAAVAGTSEMSWEFCSNVGQGACFRRSQRFFQAMAFLELLSQRHGQHGRPLQTSCLLLACVMCLGKNDRQHPFIQASGQRPRVFLHSPPFVGGRLSHQETEPTEPVRGSRLLWLPCLALLGTVTHRRGVPCFAQERLRGSVAPRNGQGAGKSTGRGDDPRALTSKIREAETVAELLNLLDGAVDSSIFNHIHASTACTSLAAFHAKERLCRSDAKNPVIERLGSRMQDLLAANEVGPRELSNIIWACAKLFVAVPVVLEVVPALAKAASSVKMNARGLSNSLWAAAQLLDASPQVSEVVPALLAEVRAKAGAMMPGHLSNVLVATVKLQESTPRALEMVPTIAVQIASKADRMNPQDLAKSLWAAARLQHAAPEVLQVVPAVVAQIPNRVDEMIPRALSKCLFAAMRLADAVPQVLEAVPCLVKEVPGKVGAMNARDLASCLEALVCLEERLSILELPHIAASAATRLKRLLGQLRGKDLLLNIPMVTWACAKADACDDGLLKAVAVRFASRKWMTFHLPPWNLCALAWAYRYWDVDDEFRKVRNRLEVEISARGLREEEVLATRR